MGSLRDPSSGLRHRGHSPSPGSVARPSGRARLASERPVRLGCSFCRARTLSPRWQQVPRTRRQDGHRDRSGCRCSSRGPAGLPVLCRGRTPPGPCLRAGQRERTEVRGRPGRCPPLPPRLFSPAAGGSPAVPGPGQSPCPRPRTEPLGRAGPGRGWGRREKGWRGGACAARPRARPPRHRRSPSPAAAGPVTVTSPRRQPMGGRGDCVAGGAAARPERGPAGPAAP